MNSVDTAKAWARLISLKTGKDYRPGQTSHDVIYGLVKEFEKEIGVDYDTIYQYLKLLAQPAYVLEDLLKGRPRTYYREAEKAPKCSGHKTQGLG